MSFSLRPFQKEALALLQSPGHLLCISPTGSGKSLIYERAAAEPERRTLLVTPLTALARQQGERLAANGVRAFLGTGPQRSRPRRGESGAWIVSPESLLSTAGYRVLQEWAPNLAVIDECHCLWDWGDRFRPAFRQLPRLVRQLGIPRSLWLTATLPQTAREELRDALGLPMEERGRFDLPPGLRLIVERVRWDERISRLLAWVQNQSGPGVIFVPTREWTEKLRRLLEAAGVPTLVYHAGLAAEERLNAEKVIRAGNSGAIIATSAFGMGMDHPHLGWCVLWQAPASLLSLAQAIGRVGRHVSRDAQALVLWDDEDFRLLSWIVRGSPRVAAELQSTLRFLSSSGCRRQALGRYFGDPPRSGLCNQCDFCCNASNLI